MAPSDRRKVESLISEAGNDGSIKNEAAMTISHMIGPKAAAMFGNTLKDLADNPQQYSAVFKDKGLRLKAMRGMAEKARVSDFPTSAEAVYIEFDNFMAYCGMFYIAPTLGLFAIWLGTDLDGFEKQMSRYTVTRPETAMALEVCKETLRGFLESKAMDGDVAPAVYLHQNKYAFHAVETAPAKVDKSLGEHVKDAAQIGEVIRLLPVEDNSV